MHLPFSRRATLLGSFLIVFAPASPLTAQLGSRPADEWALVLESGARLEALAIENVVAQLGLRPGEIVADIGAGTGIFSVPMARAVGPSGVVLAVEVDPGFLPMIRERSATAGVTNIQAIEGEFEDPKLPRTDVQVAFFHDVLHHIDLRAEYIRTVARYMAPNSRMVVVDYERGHPANPHLSDSTLMVDEAEVRVWMEGAGFTLAESFDLFEEKFFTVYRRGN